MKSYKDKIIIGIDHGYGNIKTANHCFKTGITTHDSELLFTKLGGTVAYHGYQSFQAGEVTPEEAHRIGIETAKRVWGDDYEIVVTTHLNTANLHNHIVVGVELSYLTEYEQQDLFEAVELEDKTPSLSQAIQMKKLSQAGKLDSETISKIISKEKPNQREKISFQLDELSKYFPKKFTPQDIYKRLLKLAKDDYRRRQRNREER